jgi:hypothetical protein
MIALSSATVGIEMAGCLSVFDIVFDLAAIGSAQTDDSPYCAAIHKGYVVESRGLRRESNHTQLGVLEAIINPDQRSFPIKFIRDAQGNTMFGTIAQILGGIELDLHHLL